MGTRAVIWRKPRVETGGGLRRAGLELILHARRLRGPGIDFGPPRNLRGAAAAPGLATLAVARLAPLSMTGDAWLDLLRSSGRFG
jgi:hypothetical protein